MTAPIFDELKAQNKDETTISIWPARYTPSRVLATAGYGAKAAVKGIDPIIEAYQKLHPNVKIKVIGQAINKDVPLHVRSAGSIGQALPFDIETGIEETFATFGNSIWIFPVMLHWTRGNCEILL